MKQDLFAWLIIFQPDSNPSMLTHQILGQILLNEGRMMEFPQGTVIWRSKDVKTDQISHQKSKEQVKF